MDNVVGMIETIVTVVVHIVVDCFSILGSGQVITGYGVKGRDTF